MMYKAPLSDILPKALGHSNLKGQLNTFKGSKIIQISPYIMLCLRSTTMNHVIKEQFYKGITGTSPCYGDFPIIPL